MAERTPGPELFVDSADTSTCSAPSTPTKPTAKKRTADSDLESASRGSATTAKRRATESSSVASKSKKAKASSPGSSSAAAPRRAATDVITLGSESEEDSGDSVQICEHFSIGEETRACILRIARFARKQHVQGAVDCQGCADSPHRIEMAMWACLQCYYLGCSAQKHSYLHATHKEHWVAQSLKQPGVLWCFACTKDFRLDLRAIERMEQASLPISETPAKRRRVEDVFPQSMKDFQSIGSLLKGKLLWENEAGGTAGIANLGNTCFMSASLQMLFHCPPLIHLFTQPELLHVCRKARIPLVRDFMELAALSWGGKYRTLAPREFLRSLLLTFAHFRGYGQQDAHEFLRCLLDYLHEEFQYCVAVYDDDTAAKSAPATKSGHKSRAKKGKSKAGHKSAHKSGHKSRKYKSTETSSTEMKTDSVADECSTEGKRKAARDWKVTSVIGDLFGGEVISEVRCTQCDRKSETREIIYDISVQIPKGDQIERAVEERSAEPLKKQSWFSSVLSMVGLSSQTIPLDTCLHTFCTSEDLMHTEQYHCERCKKKVNATKSLSFSKIPEILMIHIKRFEHTTGIGFWNGSSKLSTPVSFVMEGFDFSPYINAKRRTDACNRDCLYDLCGVVKHMGATGGGHYVAYGRHPATGIWYHFDDSRVHVVEAAKVATDQAYILTYCRRRQRRYVQALLKTMPTLAEETSKSEERKSAEEIVAVSERKHEDDTVRTEADSKAAAASASSSGDSETRVKKKKKKSDKIEVSRYWFHKLLALSSPGPLDNLWMCCYHGLPLGKEHVRREYLSVSIDRKLWDSLTRQFGLELTPFSMSPGCDVQLHKAKALTGSSSLHATDDSVDEEKTDGRRKGKSTAKRRKPWELGLLAAHCEDCERQTLKNRREFEKAEIKRLEQESRALAMDCVVSMKWADKWRQFVHGKSDEIAGVLDNLYLEGAENLVKNEFEEGKDFLVVSTPIWRFLLDLYGGGPKLVYLPRESSSESSEYRPPPPRRRPREERAAKQRAKASSRSKSPAVAKEMRRTKKGTDCRPLPKEAKSDAKRKKKSGAVPRPPAEEDSVASKRPTQEVESHATADTEEVSKSESDSI